ncbi:hypothetical protein Dsin_009088 [Dipteronia sinensis]|uniref:RNase H type-1 domain-containing protein n=1 Tax=Dipteronia sinensis TaxID=43782 RepID=A0AAE0AQE3_9ROSI|nr:hypothetical protein Dsin_009088 [Dipteronia sinensis]
MLYGCATRLKVVRRDWLAKKAMRYKGQGNFFDLITDLAKQNNKEDLKLFCIIIWRLWCLRNALVYGGGNQHYEDVLSWSRNYDVACEITKKDSNQKGEAIKRSDLRWKAHDTGYYKVKCSDMADLGGKRLGIGIVIRNCDGVVMASCALVIDATLDWTVAGIMVVYKGILFSLDCDLSPCEFESDKAAAVERILNGKFLGAKFGHILKDIEVLKTHNYGMKFRTTTKTANHTARRLARMGAEDTDDRFWMEEGPCIRGLVEADMFS